MTKVYFSKVSYNLKIEKKILRSIFKVLYAIKDTIFALRNLNPIFTSKQQNTTQVLNLRKLKCLNNV